MPKFPDRWFDYTNTGDKIQGTRLITFKVPLKESFFTYTNKENEKKVPEEFRFTPTTLLECMNDQGLKLGLVIDLTFTDRYYDPEEFTRKGVQYQKIFVEGHVIPKKEVIEKFYETIDKFLETSEEDSLIGVHCTHGVNRTGYVVCRYMVEHLGMKATEALEAYKLARGYPVERPNYINDLKKRAGEEYEEVVETEHSQHGASSRGYKHGPGQKRGRGGNYSHNHEGGGNYGPRYRGRGHHHNGRWNENSSEQCYDQGEEQWGNYNGQGGYGWSGDQYGVDPTGYGYGYHQGYDAQNWRGQQQWYQSNCGDNYYGGNHSAGGNGYNQQWGGDAHGGRNNGYNQQWGGGSHGGGNNGYNQQWGGGAHGGGNNGYNQQWGGGANGGWNYGYNSHIPSNEHSEYNSRNGSYDRRNYSRQNSSDSRKEGRPKGGR